MVTKHYMENRRYEGTPGKFTAKVEKAAVARAQQIHKQDTEARYEPLLDEHGNRVIGPDGRPVETILGPLTKKNVPVGRHIDVLGRGRELRAQADQTRGFNEQLRQEAIGRAANADPTDFVVGGRHQWSQNLAYSQPNNPTAGTTRPRGPGATGGSASPAAGARGTPGGRATYPLEFEQRRIDWEGAHREATGLVRPITAAGAAGQRWGARSDARATARDEARGFIRPVIGFRGYGEGVNDNFSLQQFSPPGGGPAATPRATTPVTPAAPPAAPPPAAPPPVAPAGTPIRPRPGGLAPMGPPPGGGPAPAPAPAPQGPKKPSPVGVPITPRRPVPLAPAAAAPAAPAAPAPIAAPANQPPVESAADLRARIQGLGNPAPAPQPNAPFRQTRAERTNPGGLRRVAKAAPEIGAAARAGFTAGEVVFPEGGGIPGAAAAAGYRARKAWKGTV